MDVLEQMTARRHSFTPNDELIYSFVMNDPEAVATLTTTALADRCGVSQPALTRFVKTLGYGRYQEFRSAIIGWLTERHLSQETNGGRLPYFSGLERALSQLEELLTDDYLSELSAYISSFERVFATGTAKSMQPARLLEQLMVKSGRIVQAYDAGYLGEVADAMRERDLIIVFSVGQQQASFSTLAQSAGKVLLCTATPVGPLSDTADRSIVFPSAAANPEEGSVSPVMFDMFVELLVRYLMCS